MSHPPSFPFYPRQWLGDDAVLLMEWEARAMHLHLMLIAWQQTPPCSLPDDDLTLKTWCGKPKRWRTLKKQILTAWKLIDGRWVQEGLLRAWDKQHQYSESRRHAAEARWGKKDAYALHTDMHMQCSSSSSSSSSSDLRLREEKIVADSTSLESASGTLHGHNSHKKRRSYLADDEFLAALKENPAYRGLDIERESHKCKAWLMAKGQCKELTRRRLVNWLNRAERPMRTGKERIPL